MNERIEEEREEVAACAILLSSLPAGALAELATTSVWLTVNQIFIKNPYGQSTTIASPCFDCPERDEIERRGLPTI